MRALPLLASLLFVHCAVASAAAAGPADESRLLPLQLTDSDVLPTGNEWISLPTIRASDGALESFNVLSWRDRGLLEVTGAIGAPVLRPYFQVEGQTVPFSAPRWAVIDYWIPTGKVVVDDLELTLTYCAPPGARAAFLRMTLTNHRAQPIHAALGAQVSWGDLNRVTYTPVALRGEHRLGAAPWVDDGEVFSYITHDTQFAWSVLHPGAKIPPPGAPVVPPPGLGFDAAQPFTVAPGGTVETCFVLGAGLEEYSAPHNAKALRELLDRTGAARVIADTAAWCRARTRRLAPADLDLLMNRNLLFTAFYAWGRTLDTEQVVGVTSRSPRYYVSAAYWDRDAMLWSFPGLLDLDPALARDALAYALTVQLRNTGTHSRFIDGTVLEDGFQLDEAAAPVVALGRYMRQTGDTRFLRQQRDAVDFLRDRLCGRHDAATGLYSSLQDAQDEFQKLPFITYDNVLVWSAFQDLAALYTLLDDAPAAAALTQRAADLRTAILARCIATPPGATSPIYCSATDGHTHLFTEIPPGSQMKLPLLGFVAEDDPVFSATYEWLHSPAHPYSFAGQPYGLPGSYRVPFTTAWSVADHLRLARSREQALKILRASNWDGGIITEGLSPQTGKMDQAGRAFATAAGYVADALWQTFRPEPAPAPPAPPAAR